jgi:hypothetical protein
VHGNDLQVMHFQTSTAICDIANDAIIGAATRTKEESRSQTDRCPDALPAVWHVIEVCQDLPRVRPWSNPSLKQNRPAEYDRLTALVNAPGGRAMPGEMFVAE